MKRLLLFFCLAVLRPLSYGQTSVYETGRGSATVTNVVLSTVAPTNLDANGRKLDSRFRLEIWNDDASRDIFCGFSTNVSSTASSANYGRRIATRTAVTWLIPDVVTPVCVSTEAAGAGPRVVYSQFY